MGCESLIRTRRARLQQEGVDSVLHARLAAKALQTAIIVCLGNAPKSLSELGHDGDNHRQTHTRAG
jgi:hypothetical protein